ncbi:helix-turn-helix domain-containing protein [Pantoea ananatis]|uniref:helix-turn-helix domain-containing protein n=1 Tax=Pantoea ananas TaxID=553 RepID=UPI00234FEC43|nr:helix-turn-helix domain-containing protein [Pantoea ananatis]MDC7862239.1 DNA-binding protein [Pantoea ananatis]
MSMELMVKAMKTKVGNPLRKLVLIKLADNAGDKGECWPSYQHIADQCEISKRSVMTHIENLCAMGLLKKELRAGPKGNSSNVYFITLDGAGDSLPSAANSPGGAGDSLGGSAGAAPRISHSFEPVNEPVNEPKTIGTQANASEPKKVPKTQFSDDFESAWKAYPKRAGGNNKQTAWKAWSARIREGVTVADMHSGVQRYAAFIAATGKIGSEYVKQAATFFGRDHYFAESWAPPTVQTQRNSSTGISRHNGFDNRDYGTTTTPAWAKRTQ